MTKGLVFNIQRYSIHDGTGIRTIVFLMGCPLHCPWCSNPESQGPVQPKVWKKNKKPETLGRWMSVEEVIREVEKDEIFYRTSGGGLTLSGGEVLMQADFASQLLRAAKELGISTAIETAGSLPPHQFEKVLPYADQILFDLKIMDPARALAIIGDKMSLIKTNFEAALRTKTVQLIPRVPLIPGYTVRQENLEQIRDYLEEQGIHELHILPFHQFGSQKYEDLDQAYALKNTPLLKKEEVEQIREFFEHSVLNVVVSGLA